MENNDFLPIVLIAKREKDVLQTEGGGADNLPKIVLDPTNAEQRSILRAKSDIFVSILKGFEDFITMKSSNNSPLPTTVKVKLNEAGIAKSHRASVSNLINKEKDRIVGMDNNYDLLLRIDNNAQYQSLMNRFSNIDNYYYGLSCIDEVSLNRAQISSIEGITDYKIKLINFDNYSINNNVAKYFEKFLRTNNILFKKCNYSNESIIYKLTNISQEKIAVFDSYKDILNSIVSIEPMPKYSVSLDIFTESKSISTKQPNKDECYPTVGVLDNGIAKIDYLNRWIIGERSPYLESSISNTHGTFVAGIINYGDELLGNSCVGGKPCKLFNAAVMPSYDITEDELIDNIREVISAHNDIKIWNLSLGTQAEADEQNFSDFAIALDSIQTKYDVLFVKSAGNSKRFDKTERISRSADSVKSLVVGSIAQEDGYVPKDYPSPFSRIGRGPANIIKPEVVHYGGNCDDSGRLIGVRSFSSSGEIVSNSGTSFSTPRIAALAANLEFDLGYFDPLLIKGLIIHNSHYTDCLLEQEDRIKTMGFGLPTNVKKMLRNDNHEITLIFRDNLEKGKFIDIFELPVPDYFTNGETCFGEITVTLVYNQILDEKQGSEYCQSNMEVKMGKYDKIKERDIENSNILKNKYGRESSVNILNKNKYSKRLMNQSNSVFSKSERMLVEYGDKYYPIKKYCIDLSELTPANQRLIKAGNKWYLQLKGLYRDYIVNQSTETGEVLNQDFCLLVTIKDPTRTHEVYNDTIQSIDNNNFWHTPLMVENRVNVSI